MQITMEKRTSTALAEVKKGKKKVKPIKIASKVLDYSYEIDPQMLERLGIDKKHLTSIIKYYHQLVAVHENLRELDDTGYEVIRTKERLQKYIDMIKEKGGVAVDTEASGLSAYDDVMAGVCLYTVDEVPAYVPTEHIRFNLDNMMVFIEQYLEFEKGNYKDLIDTVDDEVKEMLRDILADTNIKQVYHNAKFDLKMLKVHLGVLPEPYWDTMIAGHILNENEMSYSLKNLWAYYIKDNNVKADKFNALFKGVDFRHTIPELSVKYSAKDSLMTYELFDFQREHLNPNSDLAPQYKLYEDIEKPLIRVLAEIELYGTYINEETRSNLEIKYVKKLTDIKQEIYDFISQLETGHLDEEVLNKLDSPINLGSPAQKAILLYDILGLRHDIKDRKTTARSTAKPVLIHLAEKYIVDEEVSKLMNLLVQYNAFNKLTTSFILNINKFISPTTNKVHAGNRQTGTVTGRMSMSEPNLQQIPSRSAHDIRNMYVPQDGHYMIGADFSQEEPRILAFVSDDIDMRQTFLDNKDIYVTCASMIYNKPYNECCEFNPDTGEEQPEGKKLRASVKPIILGKMYGRSAKSIAEQLGVSEIEGQAIIDDFDRNFPNVERKIKQLQTFAKTYGYVETVYNRKRRLPDMQLPNTWANRSAISGAERQCMNAVIQGTAGDILKKAVVLIHNDKILRDLGFHLLFTVHDEIIGEAPKANAKKCADRMCELMIYAPTDRVDIPMSVDAEVCEFWYGPNLYSKLEEEENICA